MRNHEINLSERKMVLINVVKCSYSGAMVKTESAEFADGLEVKYKANKTDYNVSGSNTYRSSGHLLRWEWSLGGLHCFYDRRG